MMKTARRDTVLQHLEERLEDGNNYVKAKQIARQTDLSSKQVAAELMRLSEDDYVEMWSNGSGATWKITFEIEREETVMHYPQGHCQDCGEPLKWTPCLNCGTLDYDFTPRE